MIHHYVSFHIILITIQILLSTAFKHLELNHGLVTERIIYP